MKRTIILSVLDVYKRQPKNNENQDKTYFCLVWIGGRPDWEKGGTAPELSLIHIFLPQAKEVARSYELTDDFAATPQYERLYTELTGTVQILLDNGVQ